MGWEKEREREDRRGKKTEGELNNTENTEIKTQHNHVSQKDRLFSKHASKTNRGIYKAAVYSVRFGPKKATPTADNKDI